FRRGIAAGLARGHAQKSARLGPVGTRLTGKLGWRRQAPALALRGRALAREQRLGFLALQHAPVDFAGAGRAEVGYYAGRALRRDEQALLLIGGVHGAQIGRYAIGL